MAAPSDDKSRALATYKRKLTECREIENRLKDLRVKVNILNKYLNVLYFFRRENHKNSSINLKMIFEHFNLLVKLLEKF